MSLSFGLNEPLSCPKNALFCGVMCVYFVSFLLEHPVLGIFSILKVCVKLPKKDLIYNRVIHLKSLSTCYRHTLIILWQDKAIKNIRSCVFLQ